MLQIAANFKSIQEKIELLQQRYAYKKSIRLIAVSKMHPFESVLIVAGLGQKWFGENYADEMIVKVLNARKINLAVQWSFIGSLQSNKIAKIVEHADEIQSACTEKHFRFIDRYAGECGKTNFPVFILVNAANEPQKSGCSLKHAADLASFVRGECTNLELQGVMAIPPAIYDDSHLPVIPELYLELRKISDQIGSKNLSLGMSLDLELAMASKTDVVRIGTQIFGSRV